MIIQEVYEYEASLSDGQNVSVSVELEYETECDCFCSDVSHAHIIDYTYLIVSDDDTGLDIQFNDELKTELDGTTDAKFYAELERRVEELECVG